MVVRLKDYGYPSDMRWNDMPSDVTVLDAKTGKVKRTEPPLPPARRERLPIVLRGHRETTTKY